MTESTAQILDPRRWRALAFIALAQLMVVLDGTIVNIALPSAQRRTLPRVPTPALGGWLSEWAAVV